MRLSADVPPGLRFGERADPRPPNPIARNSANSPLMWGDRAESRTSRISGRFSRISAGYTKKCRCFKDPPSGGYYGEAARPRGGPAQSEAIQRNRHLIGAIGRSFAPRGSAVGRVGSPGNPENSRRPANPPGRFCGDNGARLRAGFRPIGRNSTKSPHTWRDRAAFRTSRTSGRLPIIYARNREKSRWFAGPPFGGYCGHGERSRQIPPGRPQFSEKASYLGE